MIAKRFNKLRTALFAAAGAIVIWVAPGTAQAEWGLNLQRPVTEIARVQFDLHMLIMYIVTVIGIIVFGVMFYSIAKFRKSKGAQPAKFSHSTKAEVLWTVIPTLILIGMAVPSTKALLLMEDTTDSDMVLKVTGSSGAGSTTTWRRTFRSSVSLPRRRVRLQGPRRRAKTTFLK